MFHIIKTKPAANGSYCWGVFHGTHEQAPDEYGEDLGGILDVTGEAEAAIAKLMANPNGAITDLGRTMSDDRYGFLDMYESCAVHMQRVIGEYAEFAKQSPAFEDDEDLDFRDFVEEHGYKDREHTIDWADRMNLEWIARVIVGRPGAPALLDDWFHYQQNRVA